jgi:hypothetical protein
VTTEDTEAAYNGGGINVYNSGSGQNTSVSGLSVKRAKATGASSIYASGGGAYIGVLGPLNIQRSLNMECVTIANTEAAYSGGGLYVQNYGSGYSTSVSDLKISNTKTTRVNDGYGGGLYFTGGNLNISGYASDNTSSTGYGGSLYIWVMAGGIAKINGAEIKNSAAVNSASDAYAYGGGGIYINGGSSGVPAFAEFSNVTFNSVRVTGDTVHTAGGAVFCDQYIRLTMSDCSINGASSNQWGGAIGGSGDASCVLSGVSFSGCSATKEGSILFGNAYSGTDATGMAYVVRPGCTVEGIPITTATWSSFLNMVYLINGSTINPDL